MLRRVAALVALILVVSCWMTIIFTIYWYFPAIMSPTNRIQWLIAIASAVIFFPLVRSVWKSVKGEVTEDEAYARRYQILKKEDDPRGLRYEIRRCHKCGGTTRFRTSRRQWVCEDCHTSIAEVGEENQRPPIRRRPWSEDSEIQETIEIQEQTETQERDEKIRGVKPRWKTKEDFPRKHPDSWKMCLTCGGTIHVTRSSIAMYPICDDCQQEEPDCQCQREYT